MARGYCAERLGCERDKVFAMDHRADDTPSARFSGKSPERKPRSALVDVTARFRRGASSPCQVD